MEGGAEGGLLHPDGRGRARAVSRRGSAGSAQAARARAVGVVGRRGGKDSIASAIACFAAGFVDYRPVLRPGEAASVLCLAVDKAQAWIVERYTRAISRRSRSCAGW